MIISRVLQRLPTSLYTGVIHFSKSSGFLAHPVSVSNVYLRIWWSHAKMFAGDTNKLPHVLVCRPLYYGAPSNHKHNVEICISLLSTVIYCCSSVTWTHHIHALLSLATQQNVNIKTLVRTDASRTCNKQ